MSTSRSIEESDSHEFRSGENLSMDDILFGEKLNLGKDSRPLEKTKATECKKVPEDFLSRSGEILSMDDILYDDILLPYEPHHSEVSRSLMNKEEEEKKKKKKPKEMECTTDLLSGEEVPMELPKLEPDEYLDYFPQHSAIVCGVRVYSEVIQPIKKKKPKAIEKKDNMRENEGMEEASRIFAGAALSYLHEEGHNLELVKPGLYDVGEVTLGYRVHFNFKAKREDDPSAPVEMYFGQLCDFGKTNIVVECCVSMGESDSLPYDPENRGCGYCSNLVHHPLGGCKGIVWGLLTYSLKAGTYVVA